MAYVPHSDDDRRAMLEALGLEAVDELFATIPASLRATAVPDLPAPLTEMELVAEMAERAAEPLA